MLLLKKAAPVRVVIQARVGSTRLPSKILLPLAGRAMLAQVVARLRAAAHYGDAPWEVHVATTALPADDATAELCRQLGAGCHRGSPDDVLERYLLAAADLPDDAIVVRATADNPLYCPQRTAEIVRRHRLGSGDYTCIENLSYVVPEVMQAGALRAMARLAVDPYCREHVTPYFRQTGRPFQVRQLPERWRGLRPTIRLTVDTPEERARMVQMFEELPLSDPHFPLEGVYAWVDRERRESSVLSPTPSSSPTPTPMPTTAAAGMPEPIEAARVPAKTHGRRAA